MSDISVEICYMQWFYYNEGTSAVQAHKKFVLFMVKMPYHL